MKSILLTIEENAKAYAACSASNDEEFKRIQTDFQNGAISVYKEVFNLYLHGDLSFSLGS